MKLTKRKLKKGIKRLLHLPGGFDFFRYAANKLRAIYYKKTKSTKVAYPSTLMIESTNLCNLKCITCPREYTFGDEMDKGYINLDMLKKVIDEAYPYIDSVGLTGLGETFLHKDLEEAIDYIRSKSKGIIISASINAHLPKSVDIASRIINKIDTIQISIDGIGEVYEKVRLKGKFDFFLDCTKRIIALAKDSDTHIMFNFIIVKENYHQLTDMIKFAHELGVEYLNFMPVNVVSTTIADVSYYEFFHSNEFQMEYKRAEAEAKKYPDIEVTHYDFTAPKGFGKCRYPWSHFYITWDGYIPPCCAKPFPKIMHFGNVFEKGLMDSLNSKEFREFRAYSLRNETPDFCKKCFVVDMDPLKEIY